MTRNFNRWRRAWHGVYAALTPGDWPARLATRLTATFDVAVEEYEVSTPTPLGDASALRIGFASDLHAGPATPWPVLEKGLAMLASRAPDVVLLGGDYVGHDLSGMPRLVELIGGLRRACSTWVSARSRSRCAGTRTAARCRSTAGR